MRQGDGKSIGKVDSGESNALSDIIGSSVGDFGVGECCGVIETWDDTDELDVNTVARDACA
jgi:hypothetical protein